MRARAYVCDEYVKRKKERDYVETRDNFVNQLD